jgi:hypothetical protein
VPHFRAMGQRFNRLDKAWEFPGAFAATLVVGGLLVFLVVAWPVVAFHGKARVIGEVLWLGIPALIAVSIYAAARWSTRDARKLKRLQDERLWAEGSHPDQIYAEKMRQADARAELAWREAEAKRRAAKEAAKEAARARKQQVRDAIKDEERLRDER